MDKDKIPNLVFYCISFVIITYLYEIKVAIVLGLMVIIIWAYTNLFVEAFSKAKDIRARKHTTNKKIIISAFTASSLTIFGAFLFTKLIWGYVAVLTAIIFILFILNQLKKEKFKNKVT